MSNRRPLTEKLIEDGLGYCCTWAFFSLFHNKHDISNRLGICEARAKLWKAKHKRGELECKCKEKCLKDKLPKARRQIELLRSIERDASSSEEV